MEEGFESHWERCLDEAHAWEPFFQSIETLDHNELKATLVSFQLVTDTDLSLFGGMRRSAEGRAVPLLSPFTGTDQDIALLALAFSRSEQSALAVPYARLQGK
jgi:hypothetical protein